MFGSVIDQVTVPVGCVAPETPVTVVVSVVVPPKIGEEEAAKVIVGNCCGSAALSVLLEATP